jgi:hypothetical protein
MKLLWIVIPCLILVAGSISYAVRLQDRLEWNEKRYQDYVTLMDAAMERQTLITMPESCATQLQAAEFVQIRIIK